MKKIFIISICLILIPSSLLAETSEEKRRIEEKKRESLESTETDIAAKREPRPPLEPIDMVYLMELSLRKVVFGYDACKTLVILLGVENDYIDLDSQVDFLKKNGLLPKKLESKFEPMKPLRKGVAAYMFAKALGIKGGVILRVFSINPRYALKELVYQGIMSPGNTNDIVSGDELFYMLTQSTAYMAEAKINEKPK